MIAVLLWFWSVLAVATPCAVIGEPGNGDLHVDQFMSLAVGDDQGPALNALFQCAADNPVDSRGIYWPDSYTTRTSIHVQGLKANQYPGSVEDLQGLPVVLEIDGGQAQFHNIIHVRGKGATIWATRGTTDGVILGYVIRTRFAGFDVRNVRRNCVSTAGFGGVPQNLIATDLGSITGINCGPSPGTAPGNVARLDVAFTARADNSSPQSSTNQLTTLTLPLSTTTLPGDVRSGDLVFIEDRPYVLRGAVDYTQGTIQVFPFVEDLEQQTGTVEFASGAALYIIGGNTTGLRALTVTAQRAGVGIDFRGLYGGFFGNLTTEVTGVGLRYGSDIGGAHLGAYLGHAHIESTKAHIVQVQRSAIPGQIGSFVVFDLSKMWGLTTRKSNLRWGMIESLSMHHKAIWDSSRVQLPRNTEPNTPIFGNSPEMDSGTIMKTNPTIELEWNEDANTKFAYDTFQALLMGNTGGDPGVVTFKRDANDVSGTINGASGTYVLDPTGPVLVYGTRHADTGDWKVYHHTLQ